MAKISTTNPRFRNRKTICRDLSVVLSSDLSYGTKFAVAAEITWVWSEFDGKTKGCWYWSREALASEKGAPFIHENVVRKSLIIMKLFDIGAPSALEVEAVLFKLCIGVVVTNAEDSLLTTLGLKSRMPEDWDGANPW